MISVYIQEISERQFWSLANFIPRSLEIQIEIYVVHITFVVICLWKKNLTFYTRLSDFLSSLYINFTSWRLKRYCRRHYLLHFNELAVSAHFVLFLIFMIHLVFTSAEFLESYWASEINKALSVFGLFRLEGERISFFSHLYIYFEMFSIFRKATHEKIW